MHTATTARETLDFLWDNYLTLAGQVDLDAMQPDVLDLHIQQNSPEHPLKIAAWLARLGYFISAWSLWEYYSRCVCKDLPRQEQKASNESMVEWVARSLSVNAKTFRDHKWFASANHVRNLIAHSGARVDNDKAKFRLQQARTAFSDIETSRDGYLDLTHCQVADLQHKIKNFIRERAQQGVALEPSH